MIHLPADHVHFTITRDVPWAASRDSWDAILSTDRVTCCSNAAPNGRGQNGSQCSFCHLCPPGEKKRRQKIRRKVGTTGTGHSARILWAGIGGIRLNKATNAIKWYINIYYIQWYICLVSVVAACGSSSFFFRGFLLFFRTVLDVLGPRNSFFSRPPIFLQHLLVFGWSVDQRSGNSLKTLRDGEVVSQLHFGGRFAARLDESKKLHSNSGIQVTKGKTW